MEVILGWCRFDGDGRGETGEERCRSAGNAREHLKSTWSCNTIYSLQQSYSTCVNPATRQHSDCQTRTGRARSFFRRSVTPTPTTQSAAHLWLHRRLFSKNTPHNAYTVTICHAHHLCDVVTSSRHSQSSVSSTRPTTAPSPPQDKKWAQQGQCSIQTRKIPQTQPLSAFHAVDAPSLGRMCFPASAFPTPLIV